MSDFYAIKGERKLGPYATREDAKSAGERAWPTKPFNTYRGLGYFDMRPAGPAPKLFPGGRHYGKTA